MSPAQDFFRPSEGFRKDLRWWERIAPHLNFKAMMIPTVFGPPESIEMDASKGWGIGAVNHISREFFQVPTPEVIRNLPIHCAEMAALMLAIDCWNGQRSDPLVPSKESIFKSSKIRLLSDNQAVIFAINNGRATDDFLCVGMRFIHYQMALVDGHFDLAYINTKDNIWADGLSRGDDQVVQELLKKEYRRVFVPEERLKIIIDMDI